MPLQPLHRQSAHVRHFVLVVFWMEAAAILWGASFGGAFQARVTQVSGLGDKALHALGFAAIALTALWLWKPAWRTVSILFVFAAAIEAVQSLLPGRDASLADLAASTAGLVAAWTLFQAAAAIEAGAACC